MTEPLLTLERLTAVFDTKVGAVRAVDNVDLVLRQGETVALVGESGSGKSALAMAALRLLRPPGRIAGGAVRLAGRDLVALPERDMRRVRGKEIAIVFQEPATSLNPLMVVGRQIAEAITEHEDVCYADAKARTIVLLRHVGIPAPEQRFGDYPHQMSGGMRQRVAIAMALACRPAVLLADEPTTALDVTVQAQVLALLERLKMESGMGVLLITHDLGIVADHAQSVAVMYAGRIVEQGRADQVIGHPLHPYTQGLLACRPQFGAAEAGQPLPEIAGTVPSLTSLPSGCTFAARCVRAEPDCYVTRPSLMPIGDRRVACLVAQRELS